MLGGGRGRGISESNIILQKTSTAASIGLETKPKQNKKQMQKRESQIAFAPGRGPCAGFHTGTRQEGPTAPDPRPAQRHEGGKRVRAPCLTANGFTSGQ